MTTIGRIEQLTTHPTGYTPEHKQALYYLETPEDGEPQHIRNFVTIEEHQSVLDRLTALEREIRTLKDQMKVAASLIKKGY